MNNFIKKEIKSGDFVYVKERTVPNNGNPFTVHELFKEGSNKPIGQLSRDAGRIMEFRESRGFVVNEVVIWNYEDTEKFDIEHGTDYSGNWCSQAIDQGYIYLVDFAGYGNPVS